MDKQAVFDKVANHLLTQNARSIDIDGNCLYRDKFGMMCGIGCLILDKYYDPNIEGKGVGGGKDHPILIRVIEKSLDCKTNHDDRAFLCELQRIHDNQYPSLWKDTLRKFAKGNGLEFNL